MIFIIYLGLSILIANSVCFILLEPVQRKPGDIWMIYGPQIYFPSVEIEIKSKR